MTRELVERAIGGDHDAFSILVGASVDRLHAVANLILRDSDRAQDAVQEALVSAWRDVRALRIGSATGIRQRRHAGRQQRDPRGVGRDRVVHTRD